MKKSIYLTIVCLTFAMLLAGCGESGHLENSEPDTDYEDEENDSSELNVDDDGIVDSSEWIGYYESDDGQSLEVNPDMGNKLDITARTYSEEGWRDWDASAVVSTTDPDTAAMKIDEDHEVTLRLEDDGIWLDTSSVGGLFMEGMYYRQ